MSIPEPATQKTRALSALVIMEMVEAFPGCDEEGTQIALELP